MLFIEKKMSSELDHEDLFSVCLLITKHILLAQSSMSERVLCLPF